MRCHSCRRFALSVICTECRKLHLIPEPRFRALPSGLEVLSFFSYEEIEPFLLTKHYPRGWFVYRILAREAFKAIAYADKKKVLAIPVDDRLQGGYSHTAILAKALKSYGYIPLFNTLTARNRVSYAGRSLSFRLENPRDFVYSGPVDIEAVLVDDIVTTGHTLIQAQQAMQENGIKVKRAIVLADAGR